MRRILYRMSVSLDGFIEAANGDIGWSAPDPELHQHFNEIERSVDTYLYGRGLYENMAAYWPTGDQDPAAPEHEKEYARIWREKPKVIFSKTLKKADWTSRIVSGDVAEEVRKLKAQPGGEMTVGGAGLATSLIELGLVDECSLYIYPVVLGGGKPLVGGLSHWVKWKLLETRTFPGGVVLLREGSA